MNLLHHNQSLVWHTAGSRFKKIPRYDPTTLQVLLESPIGLHAFRSASEFRVGRARDG
jgi:hypothetical protein